MPTTPVARPAIQTGFFFSSAAMDESRIAIWRNITAMPNIWECFCASSLMLSSFFASFSIVAFSSSFFFNLLE